MLLILQFNIPVMMMVMTMMVVLIYNDGDDNDDCDDNDDGDNDDGDNNDVDNDDGGGERKMHFCDAAATSIVDSIPLWSEKREVNLH